MSQLASYLLSAYSFITSHSIDKLLDVGYMSKDGDPIPSFDENLLIDLCKEAQHIFEQEENILELEGDFIIVGDIHGSFHDLLRILQFIHQNNVKVLFLGDYVDRGNFSLECISILFAMKILSPNTYYLIRGNHEFDAVCSIYGFKEEILNYHDPKKSTNPTPTNHHHHHDDDSDDEYKGYDMNCYKYSEKLYESFIQAFSYLPIGALINSTTFCIHGGLSPKLGHVDYINSLIHRPITNFEDSPLLSDLVWSDPSHSSKQFEENLRGRGFLFNRESIINFLKICNLTRIVRGHQCVKNGIQKNFNDKCITVFSASSYDKMAENSSAILKLFQCGDSISCQTFSPLPRLQKSDSSYYKVQPLNPGLKRIKTCFSFLHPQLYQVGSLRLSSSGSIAQIKTQRNDCDSHHGHNLASAPQPIANKATIVKPRFITNSKRSAMSFVQRPKSFSASSSPMKVFDEYKKEIEDAAAGVGNNGNARKCELATMAENGF